MVEDSGRNIGDFEYTRRFFCRALPTQLDDNDSPTLIIQSYYVHQDNYALRVRLKTKSVRIAMTPDLDPLAVLEKYRDEFRLGSVTVKGPSVGGTRYEASRDLDSRIAGELIKRGGHVTIKNRFTDWIDEDGWNIDVFGGTNAPLIIAEAERIGPVTRLVTGPKSPTNRGSAMKGLPRIHIHDGNPNSKTNWKQTDRNSSTISAPTVWNKSFFKKKTTVGRKERCSCAAYG